MRVIVHDYCGHPFQVQLSRELARRGHDVLHLYCPSVPSGHGALERGDDDPTTFAVEPVALDATFERFGRDLDYVRYDGLDRRDVAPFARSVQALRTSLAALARVVARPSSIGDRADAKAVATEPPVARDAPIGPRIDLSTVAVGSATDPTASGGDADAPPGFAPPPGADGDERGDALGHDPTVFDTPVPEDAPPAVRP